MLVKSIKRNSLGTITVFIPDISLARHLSSSGVVSMQSLRHVSKKSLWIISSSSSVFTSCKNMILKILSVQNLITEIVRLSADNQRRK